MSKPTSLTHPGLILRDEFFAPLGITQLAAAIIRAAARTGTQLA